MLTKEFFEAFLSLFSEQNRFGLSHWIADHALFMQTAHGIPVLAFPSMTVAVEREKEKREYHLVDFVFVIVHVLRLSFCGTNFNRVSVAT